MEEKRKEVRGGEGEEKREENGGEGRARGRGGSERAGREEGRTGRKREGGSGRGGGREGIEESEGHTVVLLYHYVIIM